MKTSKRLRMFLPPAIAFSLAVLLRTGWPGLTEFKFSEARLEALAMEITREGRVPLVGVPSSAGIDHSPLSIYMYTPAVLLSASPISATLYGGFINVAAVVSCWWLGSRWPGGGKTQAFVSALLLAVSPWAVLFSRKIWQIAFVPVLAIAFFALAASAFVSGRRWSLSWSLIAYAVLVQVHPSALSLLPALFLWLVLFWRRELALPLISGGVVSVLTAIPFIIHQAQTDWRALAAVRGMSAAWDFSSVRLAWNAITGQGIDALAGISRPLLRLVPELSTLFCLAGFLLLASAIAVGWRAFRTWNSTDASIREAARLDFMLLAWLAIPILLNLRHSLDLQLHFYALSLPAASLLTGRAAAITPLPSHQASRSLKSLGSILRAGLWSALVLLTASQLASLLLLGSFVASHNTTGGFGRPMRRYMELADRLLAQARSSHASEILVVGKGISPVTDELPAIFDVLLRGQYPYRFVDGTQSALFPMYPSELLIAPEAGEASRWYSLWPTTELADGFRLTAADGTWPQSGLEPIAAPRLLENGIELQAYNWTEAQGTGCLWLQWQVLWEQARSTHFFVHIIDAEGSVVGRQDHEGYPSSARRKGDRVLTIFDITLSTATRISPQPAFRARVGMYIYPEIVNVPVVGAAGEPIASDVVVGLVQTPVGPQ